VTILYDDGKRVVYNKEALEDIDLAYAVTVHKSQGCEFDTVIIALGKMNYRLSSRKLLYTAVTRGKRKVVIIDSAGRLNKMISSPSETVRHTALAGFLSIVDKRHSEV
jgi:exodeoxyribonuclease V alpha subunit